MKLKNTSLASDYSRQLNSLSNIFISYAPIDDTLVHKLRRSFEKQNLIVWSNSSGASQTEIEARIDAADYFLSVLSPDYEKAKECRRHLRYALRRRKKVLPLIHKNVELKAFPELNLSSRPLFFREEDSFKKSFTALLGEVSTALKLDAFISYSHEDSDFAQKLAAAFVDNQRKVWLDKRNILYTENWVIAINSGIEAADNFLFVISQDSLRSENCLKELEHATKHNKRIIPLRLRDIEHSLPVLSTIHGIDFLTPAMFKKSFRKLLAALNIDVEYIREHTKLLTQSVEWHFKGRRNSLLLRGQELSSARRWVSQSHEKQPTLTSTQREFIEASVDSARRRRLGVAMTLIVAIVISIVLFSKFSDMRRGNEAKHLLAASLALRKETSDITPQSLLLALESYRRNPTIKAYQAVADGILSLTRVAYLLPHAEPLTGICFVPNSDYIATGSLDKNFRLWSAGNGTFLWRIDFLGRVTDVACSPDGKRLAVGMGNSVGLLNASDGTLLTHFSNLWRDADRQFLFSKMDHTLRSLFFSPKGRYLVTMSGGDIMGNGAAQARIWDVENQKEVGFVAPTMGIRNKIFFTPDEKFFVIAPHGGGIITIMETSSNRVVSTLPVDFSFGDFVVSSDGKHIAAGDPKGVVTIWDFDSRKIAQTIQYDSAISCLTFSPDGRYLATGTNNYYVHVWDLKEKKETSRMKHLAADVELAVFSPDSRYIVSAAWSTHEKSGAAIIWRVKDGSQVGRLTHERGNEEPKLFPDSDYYRFHFPVVRKILSSPDSRFIATVGPEAAARVWAPFEDRLEFPKPLCDLPQNCKGISANGGTAARIESNKLLIDSTVDKNVPTQSLEVPPRTSLEFISNDGQTVAIRGTIVSNTSDVQIQREDVLVFFNVRTKQPLFARSHSAHQLWRFAISSDGKYLIETRADGNHQIEIATGRVLLKDGKSVNEVAIDPATLNFDSSGVRYVYWNNSNHTVTIRETATSREIVTIRNRSQISTAVIDPTGSLVAISESEKPIAIYSTADGQEIQRILPLGSTKYLAFTGDGKYLTVGTHENTIQIWRILPFAEVARLKVDELSYLTFAPNGKLLIAVRDIVTLLDWLPENFLAAACSRLTRNLTLTNGSNT